MKRGLILAGALMAACTGTTIRSSPGAPVETSAAAPATAARIGDTIRLRGNEEGSVMDVTLVKVVDPAQPGEFDSPPSEGNRYVAVQLRLTNVGTAIYSDSPTNGTELVDGQGQGFTEGAAETNAGPGIGSPKISPGDSRLGFIAFELPKTSTLAKLQFTLDSGFGPETGEWTLV
jgi:hypothetical protein